MVNMLQKLEGLKTPIYSRAICLHSKWYIAGGPCLFLAKDSRVKGCLFPSRTILSLYFSLFLPPPREEEQICTPCKLCRLLLLGLAVWCQPSPHTQVASSSQCVVPRGTGAWEAVRLRCSDSEVWCFSFFTCVASTLTC